MQSIFRYPGGKTRKNVREKILKYMPSDIQEYREPFVGGGGIFFSIDKSIKRWINDKDENLIQVYLALRDRAAEFISKCREISPAEEGEPLYSVPKGKAQYNLRLKQYFDFFANNKQCDQALRYFFINRTVWGGRVNYSLKSRLYYSVPEGWNIIKGDKLEQAANHLENVNITSTSYEDVLLEPSDQKCWIYCDPPYLVNSNFSKTSQLYRHNFNLEDHYRFADTIKQSKHKICISYDGGYDLLKSLYKDFNIHEENWTYCGTSSAKSLSVKKSKKNGKELIITNY